MALTFEARRVRPREIAQTLFRAREALKLSQTTSHVGFFGLLATLVVLFVTIDDASEFAALFIFSWVLTIIFWVSSVKATGRKLAKVDFTERLLKGLKDELHPGDKLSVRFDFHAYDSAGKQIWEGRSPFGNRKVKYADKWLHLKLRLADGTRVRVRREVGVKTKKGSIQKEKRRLWLHVKPEPSLYDVDAAIADHDTLRRSLKTAVRESFHDPPEEFHVHAEEGTREGTIRVRVTQMDAPILPDECVALLEGVMWHLGKYRTVALGGRG